MPSGSRSISARRRSAYSPPGDVLCGERERSDDEQDAQTGKERILTRELEPEMGKVREVAVPEY